MRHRRLALWLAAALAGATPLGGGAHDAHDGAHGSAHGAAAAPDSGHRFEPPPPGSYVLPPIGQVDEHRLLDPRGQPVPLLGLAPGEAALVSFVYLSCGEACPLATATLQRLDVELAGRPELARKVQLVTVSFDPERDRPEQMAALAARLVPRGRWRFLTAADPEALRPVLSDFGQEALWIPPEAGAPPRLRHVLKVFLVDASRAVREVYSTGFLDVRVLLNDLETVTLADGAGHAERPAP